MISREAIKNTNLGKNRIPAARLRVIITSTHYERCFRSLGCGLAYLDAFPLRELTMTGTFDARILSPVVGSNPLALQCGL